MDSSGNHPVHCRSGKDDPYSGAYGGDNEQAHKGPAFIDTGTGQRAVCGRNCRECAYGCKQSTGDFEADDIRSVLDKLNEREQKVLRMRFGLDDGKEHTLEEVGQELHVTRERIRQIEAKALRKLRQSGKSAGLEGYLNQ